MQTGICVFTTLSGSQQTCLGSDRNTRRRRHNQDNQRKLPGVYRWASLLQSCVLVRLGLCKFGLQPWLIGDPLMQLHNVMLKLHLTGSLCLPVLEPLKEKQCCFGAGTYFLQDVSGLTDSASRMFCSKRTKHCTRVTRIRFYGRRAGWENEEFQQD